MDRFIPPPSHTKHGLLTLSAPRRGSWCCRSRFPVKVFYCPRPQPQPPHPINRRMTAFDLAPGIVAARADAQLLRSAELSAFLHGEGVKADT